jgi:hypothetical protein
MYTKKSNKKRKTVQAHKKSLKKQIQAFFVKLAKVKNKGDQTSFILEQIKNNKRELDSVKQQLHGLRKKY